MTAIEAKPIEWFHEIFRDEATTIKVEGSLVTISLPGFELVTAGALDACIIEFIGAYIRHLRSDSPTQIELAEDPDSF